MNIFTKLLDLNQREIDRYTKIVDKINTFEEETKKLKDSDFKKKTEEFKNRISKGETLEQILPEAYAVVREVSSRVLGKRHYDVQLIAAVALFEGKVSEQKTGEGKTLSAVPALYLRALMGKGAHLVTVNDYLARRDSGWNGPIFEMLGLSIGVIIQEGKSLIYDPKFSDESHGDARLVHLKPTNRKEVYAADVTYGTNNEFGFDYLRDNMVQSIDEMVQRGHYFAIVDEVDSVLIDEARTPLIISAPDSDPTDKYYKFADLVAKLNPDTDFTIDEKSKSATLTERGIERVEKILNVENLYEKDFDMIHHLENALRAKTLYLPDREYVVKDGQVTIVDEFTGRLMLGRRWSDGLHQAVEAKEGVKIQQESRTLATISFQNYFRMYDFLSGMTGTASTEEEEFRKIYNLDVVVIPTHRKMVRKDGSDMIYKSLSAKYTAIAEEIETRHKNGQPVLVGTTSIDKNEIVAEYLKRRKIPHNVLNAKNHEREAAILAQAGAPGAVTVATNMAGRGVDIVLGGALPEDKTKMKEWDKLHEAVIASGGLHVIGTERHESRRIDNQLRGRAGRQGDPGSSIFYLSLEDDLMRIFGGEQIKSLMDRLKLPDDEPIQNSLVSGAIQQAQVKVEGFHFDTRKRLVEFDDVTNQQRDVIYKLRNRILNSEDVHEEVLEKLKEKVVRSVDLYDEIDPEKILVNFLEVVPFDDESSKRLKKELGERKDKEEIKELLFKVVEDASKTREKQVGESVMHQIEKFAYLGAIDREWMDHIDQIDDLRGSVELRRIGQKDPLVEFKNEAFQMFEALVGRITDELSRRLFRIGVAQPPSEIPLDRARENVDRTDMTGLSGGADEALKSGEAAFPDKSQKTSSERKMGRNDPCWCGSGKKWKKCHYPQLPQ